MATTLVLKHYGIIKNGERLYYNKQLHAANIKSLEGQEFEEVIKLKTKKVSSDFHAFYRGGIIKECLQYEMFGGWTKEEVHDFFAKKYLSYEVDEKIIDEQGNTKLHRVSKIRSTSDLNSKEMSEYCEKVIRWLAYHSIIIKDPEQYKS